jgi:hypothetical protein
MTDTLTPLFARPFSRLYDEIAASHPSLLRGRVWRIRCNAFKDIDPAKCLAEGWPRCHGTTMTIDSPAERKAAEKARENRG